MFSVAHPCQDGDPEFYETLRMALRSTPVNVSILTTRDRAGVSHGLAVTRAVPFSTQSPAMIVADEIDLLNPFSRSDLRSQRFAGGRLSSGPRELPYLDRATACFFCDVQGAHAHADQTVFIGRIVGVRKGLELAHDGNDQRAPLIWINGRAVRLAEREYA